jgi:nucleoside-diphosphate-sugar epimerase
MKIFITGATGGIGKFLAPVLAQKRHELILLSRAPDEQFHSLPKASIIMGDILNPRSYREALDGVDCIIHMAAVTHTNNTKLYYRINTEGTKVLLEAASLMKVYRFIFISTRAIGKSGGGYGDSKERAEELVKNSGLAWTIVRLAEVFGISENEAISKLVRTIGKMPVVPVIGDGQYTLAPVHINDVVPALIAVLERANTQFKTYTLAGEREITYNDLIETVLRIRGMNKPVIHIPTIFFTITAFLMSWLHPRKPLIVKDQIPRLLLRKSADITLAQTDLAFAPRLLSQAFELLGGPEKKGLVGGDGAGE